MGVLYNTQDMDIDVGKAAVITPAATGPLLAATVDLVGVDGPWGRDGDYAAYVAAILTFTGYAQQTITWDPPSLDDVGAVEMIGNVPAFRCTAAGPRQRAFGILIQNAAGSKMYLNGPLLPVVDFEDVTDQLLLVLRWKPATQALSIQIG